MIGNPRGSPQITVNTLSLEAAGAPPPRLRPAAPIRFPARAEAQEGSAPLPARYASPGPRRGGPLPWSRPGDGVPAPRPRPAPAERDCQSQHLQRGHRRAEVTAKPRHQRPLLAVPTGGGRAARSPLVSTLPWPFPRGSDSFIKGTHYSECSQHFQQRAPSCQPPVCHPDASINPTRRNWNHHSHFMDGETEVQGGHVPWPRTRSPPVPYGFSRLAGERPCQPMVTTNS